MSQNYAAATNRVPGNPGVWLFLFIELTTFALLFVSYAVLYRLNPEVFRAGQNSLAMSWGAINTLLLLTSGMSMVLATSASSEGCLQQVRAALRWTFLLGAAYLVSKFSEWCLLFSNGITMSSNRFYGFYYFLTAFHWMHVLLGLICVIRVRNGLRPEQLKDLHPDALESVAAYWHTLDLLWIVIFFLLYLI
ncbi:MAG: cytochrome c oxidase subunit 3 [Ketobacteraceae bacterium]|nr:cytochrome c oxidase subunit 3 [Ketobacteraceae bacterium]